MRVLSVIKTIAILYQAQREKDEHGRLIAEHADYAMAYQLIGSSFSESLKDRTAATDERVKLIEEKGMISLKALYESAEVSSAAMSQWVQTAAKKGMVSCVMKTETSLMM